MPGHWRAELRDAAMSAIDQILERSSTMERSRLHIPEWDLEVYWAPVTLYDQQQLAKLQPTDELDLAVALLIRKAEDADGERLFSVSDTHALTHQVDAAPIARIAAAMMKDLAAEPETP